MSAVDEDVPAGSYRCEGCGGIYKDQGVPPSAHAVIGAMVIPIAISIAPLCPACWRQMDFGESEPGGAP